MEQSEKQNRRRRWGKKVSDIRVFFAFVGPLYGYVWTNQNELPANSIILYIIHWLESNAELMK